MIILITGTDEGKYIGKQSSSCKKYLEVLWKIVHVYIQKHRNLLQGKV
jgi:hypothetical protein